MTLRDFSFLYVNKEDKHTCKIPHFTSVINDLGLSTLLHSSAFDISAFVSDDAELIRYRQSLFDDFSACDELYDLFVKIRGMLRDMHEINRVSGVTETNETNLYSIKQIELYIEFIKVAYEGFTNLHDRLKSPQLLSFAEMINGAYQSSEFQNLCTETEKMLLSVANIKSVTVGFNLNAQLEPYECGLLSINTDFVKSGNIIDRLMSADFSDELTALCPLVPTQRTLKKQEYETASIIFMDAMKKSLRSGIGKWQSVVRGFLMSETSDYIALLPEMEYIIFGATIIRKLKKHKLPMCRPTIHDKAYGICQICGFYNPVTALANPNIKQIKNDFSFDADGTVYICTGPNGGGKSVFTRAIGIIYLFCGMGLPLPAKSAEISPVDMICTIFTSKAQGLSNKGGRLDEECAIIREVFSRITPHSLVLMDETLSSTGAFEGAMIARELICALRKIGAKGIFTTHMHELVGMVDEMNEETGGGIDTITTEVTAGRRTFRISRRIPDGKSYARDIAEKYGISKTRLIELNSGDNDGTP